MSRFPIRARLTAAFALAMALLLLAAGSLVYLRLEADLDESIADTLTARAQATTATESGAAGMPEANAGAPTEAEDGFAQVLTPAGELVDSSGNDASPVLSSAEAGRAAGGELELERAVPGVGGAVRILAAPTSVDGRRLVIVVGQSLEDRDETLANLVASFAIGGPIAVALASLLGYALASAGLRPVEAMRRRAEQISMEQGAGELPLPRAHDEVRRLGETLNEMLARLRTSFERERRFVADASHDLRNPIAVIRAELDAALAAGDLGPDARTSVVVAIEECDELAALAEDLLVLARAADDRLPVRPEVVDARALLESAAARFERRATERNRTILVEAEPGIAVRADPLRLRQALGNLIDNALRHGAGEVVLAGRADSEVVQLEVSDRGPGFDSDIAAAAFERFTSGDSARTRASAAERGRAGTGLGLAIVRAIAEAHGGSAEIMTGYGRDRPDHAPGRLSVRSQMRVLPWPSPLF